MLTKINKAKDLEHNSQNFKNISLDYFLFQESFNEESFN